MHILRGDRLILRGGGWWDWERMRKKLRISASFILCSHYNPFLIVMFNAKVLCNRTNSKAKTWLCSDAENGMRFFLIFSRCFWQKHSCFFFISHSHRLEEIFNRTFAIYESMVHSSISCHSRYGSHIMIFIAVHDAQVNVECVCVLQPTKVEVLHGQFIPESLMLRLLPSRSNPGVFSLERT